VGPLVISQLARAEVPSALWRKQRMGELSTEDAAVLCAEFEADYATDEAIDASASSPFVPVAVGPSLLDEAARLVAVHGLRSADAIQLASALAARAASPDVGTFAAFGAALRRAAAAEAFALYPSAT
jgi:predicted nucleic acid-binding protein